MQFGHLPVALSIATYNWNPETAAYDFNLPTAIFCIAMHWLPNTDSLMVKAGWDKKIIPYATKLESLMTRKKLPENTDTDPFWTENGGFHCTVTHSVFFAVVISLLVALFSWKYAAFAFFAILTHYLADIGSTVGLPLLWPFNRKMYTLALFKDTGWWGKDMFIGYYKQPMSWVLEGAVTIFFIYRLAVVYGWGA